MYEQDIMYRSNLYADTSAQTSSAIAGTGASFLEGPGFNANNAGPYPETLEELNDTAGGIGDCYIVASASTIAVVQYHTPGAANHGTRVEQDIAPRQLTTAALTGHQHIVAVVAGSDQGRHSVGSSVEYRHASVASDTSAISGRSYHQHRSKGQRSHRSRKTSTTSRARAADSDRMSEWSMASGPYSG